MLVGHPVGRGAVAGVVLGAIAALASAQDLPPATLEIYDAIPTGTSVAVRAGERREFALWVAGESLVYQWLLDGGPVGARRSWTYAPAEIDLGMHLVTVVVESPTGRATRAWRVQVETGPPGAGVLPVATTTAPAPTTVPTTSTTERSSTSTTERPSTTTTRVAPTTTTSTVRPTTTTTVRPTTTSTLRPTTTSTARPTTTSTLRPTTTTTVRPTTTTSARPTTTSAPTTSSTTTTAPRTGAVTEAEVRALLERYKAAWRNHDVKGLEAVGQITTEGQADALTSYFESVKDLEVDVTILEIETSGAEARVRFVRRDRFRDPAGSLVAKESPPIEKRVVRTPGGLRLASPR